MNYKTAQFNWFHPTKKPKAILVLVPGSNTDGRDMVGWKFFKDFAEKNNVSLLGCFYEDIDPSRIEGYVDAKGGSGKALLDEIATQARTEKNLNNLINIPLFIWGFSAGGQFSYEMACFAPARIRGFIVNKGGFYYTALAPEATRKIPSLWFLGNYDDYFRQSIILGIYSMNRVAGAIKWELQQENVGHAIGDSIHLSLSFFEKILRSDE